MDLDWRSFPTPAGWFFTVSPGAAQREAISAFTRVFDALWRDGALQTPISGLPEIQRSDARKSGKPDVRGSLRSGDEPGRVRHPYSLFKQPISFRL